MQETITPIERELLENELNAKTFLRTTNNGDNEIYLTTAHESPNLMTEIGRLREVTFRAAGGGTGKSMDIDKYDISENPYNQLIVWNPKEKEIVGGYRIMFGCNAEKDENGIYQFGTSGLFSLSDKFIKEYLPYTIELGRSFVQPAYQPTKDSRKGIYSLDNLWDGLGALVVDNPEMKYFFGKVTMYPHYDVEARKMIMFFLNKYFNDPDKLLVPKEPFETFSESDKLESVFIANNYDEDYKILVNKVRERNVHIPPLVNAYMNLSPTMRYFGTSLNKSFGLVEETGILVKIDDIYSSKKERHILTYKASTKK